MFVRTERLFLRPGWAEDAPELARAIAHEEVVRMLARVPWPYSEAHARWFLEHSSDPMLPSLLVTLPGEGGRIVGGCGIHQDQDRTEVGYWITPAYWEQGIASEALRGLLMVAGQLGYKRIHGRHAADNPRSERVLRKAGFRPTGRSRPIHSLGRGAQVEAPEYTLDLAGDGGENVPPMRCAA